MKKLSSINFNASTKLSAAQLIALKGGDDKRGDRTGGGVQGIIITPPPPPPSGVGQTGNNSGNFGG